MGWRYLSPSSFVSLRCRGIALFSMATVGPARSSQVPRCLYSLSPGVSGNFEIFK